MNNMLLDTLGRGGQSRQRGSAVQSEDVAFTNTTFAGNDLLAHVNPLILFPSLACKVLQSSLTRTQRTRSGQ